MPTDWKKKREENERRAEQRSQTNRRATMPPSQPSGIGSRLRGAWDSLVSREMGKVDKLKGVAKGAWNTLGKYANNPYSPYSSNFFGYSGGFLGNGTEAEPEEEEIVVEEAPQDVHLPTPPRLPRRGNNTAAVTAEPQPTFVSKRVEERNPFAQDPSSFMLNDDELNNGYEADNTPFAIETIKEEYGGNSKALEAYLEHLQGMPQRDKPGVWNRIVAGFIGAMEGANRGAGAGFAASRAALNTPYEERLQDWATKGQGLQEAANLEGQDINRYLKMMNTESLIDNRNSMINSRGVRDQAYAARTYNPGGYLDRGMAQIAEFESRGWVLQDSGDGSIVAINPRTREMYNTGVNSLDYQQFKQQQMYQGAQIRQGDARVRQGNERNAQGWSRMEESKRRWNFDNAGGQ